MRREDEAFELKLGRMCILLGPGDIQLLLQNRAGALFAGFLQTPATVKAQLVWGREFEIPDEEVRAKLTPIDEFNSACGSDVLMAYNARDRIQLEKPN